MNEMYQLTLTIHFWGTAAMVLIALSNLAHLRLSSDIRRYAKKMRMVMPMMGSLLFLMLFTGAVMMAAKHLDFTFANIVMIVFNILMIVLESKRYARLKHLNIKAEGAFEGYKALATKLLLIELGGMALIAVWMLA